MFSKYYQSELTYLRDMGQTFGNANPAIAGLLSERGADPDVERLLEGFAFLTARIRERMDDAIPEIVHLLSDLLMPHFLRTIPAASIVEMSPEIGALRGRHVIARGTPLGSIEVNGTSCMFRTTSNVELLPTIIENVNLDISSARTPVLRLQFAAPEKALPSVFEAGGMRLFINADYGIASTLLLWFLRYCTEIHVGPRGCKRGHPLPANSIKPVGFAPEEALLPWPGFAPTAFRLLQEYFTLPTKFHFIDVKGLDTAIDVATEQFDILFFFNQPPELGAPIGRQSIRLHCTPVINLFNAPAIPLRRSAIEHEQILRPIDVDPAYAEVYSADNVIGIRQNGGDRINYQPFIDFRHATADRTDIGYYQLRRCASPLDSAVDTYFTAITPGFVPVDLKTNDEVFSIELTCTNRSLAGELRAGDICQPVPGSPSVATFKNINEVTKPVTPPLGIELNWRLLAHLSLPHGSLATKESLQALLGLYNFQELSEQASGRTNRLRVDSIHGVIVSPSRRILAGAPVRGSRTTIEISEDKLTGIGDIFLFGCILDSILGEHVSINSYHQLVLKLLPSQRELQWLPRAGMKPIV